MHIFRTPVFNAPVDGITVGYYKALAAKKTRMMGLPDAKTFDDICI